jgi:phospholipid/cholesterol/gamma-HCH transport system substrate-binding protein
MDDRERNLEIRVGAFVLLMILMGLGTLLWLGTRRHVFEERTRLHAKFADVGGLVQGAPVWVGGVNVGSVAQIKFIRSGDRPLIQVDLQISRAALGLVHADSVARVASNGLLGDKIVAVSPGSFDQPLVPSGGWVQSVEPPDLDQMLRQASGVLDDTRRVADLGAKAIQQFANPRTIANLNASLEHVRALLHATEYGHGLAHALFYDQRTATDLQHLTGQLAALAGHVDYGVGRLDELLGATDAEGRQLINNVSRAAKDVQLAAAQLQSAKIIPNLDKASGNLADITGAIKRGQGTIGALVVDPTVYEQLVQVLGGVGRSKVLRMLVRYAISKSEGKSEVESKH